MFGQSVDGCDNKPMMRAVWLSLFVLCLSGCEAPPPEQRIDAVSAVGTPFLIAFKIPVCAATLVVAGPAAALQQLAAPNQDGLQPDIRAALDAGIDQNCGPPYVVAPH
jgi:class 3 adenylate cyclase